ncbi:hypothetical protein PENANT_c002G08782 [Penicillium antarcticum]|uniref:Alpha/beta hydrolase fold-3 domain-containing protein n=1 Tax=Penicillium antarcticum TaxID=416450 RepID=A0A1V6QJV9_9EURO|nr:uncharacterized protein N7508_008692 [Penicillium antarcticum]KAJ5293871.1 hypothetical protein N7508_008692 [Penicillium antarcticum]OQD89500.1 hypothetical protein PENANT_c002G08782 [Penicillium antarcticum]
MSSLKQPIVLLKAILVRLPLILKTLILHGIQMSPVTGKQDLRTELTVAVLRSFMGLKHSVLKMQKDSMRDPGIKGPMWVSKVTLPQPEIDVRDAVLRAIDVLKTGDETCDIPDIAAVEAEWTGYRGNVGKRTAQPNISEEEKYHKLRAESPSDMTILYFHGGAYFLMDPCTHRVPLAHLSHRTGAQILSIRYRLAPQNPFPAGLVDALTAYLSLIHPPPGSLHKPVPANKIILAGDSAGGNLSLVLLQTLLTLHRTSHTLHFHGKDVPIELPGGLAAVSPWCDITRSMPSVKRNELFDFLDAPPGADTPFEPIPFPPDDIWPVSPPRVDLFCNANMVLHPLVSPLTAPAELWKDAPPIWISTGEEGLTDEGLIVARRIHQAGAPLVAEMFEGMPHCHGMLMIETTQGRRFFESFASFCRDAAAGRVTSTSNLTYISYKAKSEKQIPIEKACETTDEEADALLRKSAAWRLEGEKAMQKEWRERARL